ncbi:carbonic anhydrase [Gracilibacillus halotolerans]|uniref:carbonic anhydrase n=1 Tax=Gracilibacillus halotolerans TaxID=74386 RepID=A0A841RPZ2_9BACI|nr:carbonic anhydrase [Gracilibacillus halotolerans]MBB6512718.1 carbonic anhydrase [Gracilibacillus halotolerans]
MLLNQILEFNENFVKNKQYEGFQTDRFPNKRAVIFTCMDNRLVDLMPRALNLQNGDVKMVKNAGAMITNHYDSTMKSILVAVYNLKADEIFVISHHDCGMSNFQMDNFMDLVKERGVSEETIANLEKDPKEWMEGFVDVRTNVKESVDMIKSHPLLPDDVVVHGLVIDPATGELELVERGYESE